MRASRCRFASVVLATLLALASGCGGSAPAAAPPPPSAPPFERFMGASGATFTDDFRFVGVNLDPWRLDVQAGEEYSLPELRDWVSAAVSSTGTRVVRAILIGGAFEPRLGEYSERALVQLDALVAACVANRTYLLVTLRDYLWSPWPTDAYDPYWYEGGGTTSAPNKSAILTDARAKSAFKSFMTMLLQRTNTVTGTRYADDRNILGWELINEPPISVGSSRAWIEEMSDAVRAVDPHHLIGIGIAGAESPAWSPDGASWSELDTPKLDFVDIHYYAPVRLYYPSVDQANVAALRARVARIHALGKPAVVGELGAQNDVGAPALEALYATILGAARDEGASGMLAYAWGPPGKNGWGGPGGWDLYSDDAGVCAVIRSLAP